MKVAYISFFYILISIQRFTINNLVKILQTENEYYHLHYEYQNESHKYYAFDKYNYYIL